MASTQNEVEVKVAADTATNTNNDGSETSNLLPPVHPAVTAVAESRRAADEKAMTKCTSFCLPLFTKVCGKEKAITVLHDADDAMAVLLDAGEKSLVWAQNAIKIANENVSNILFWLQAAKLVFEGDKETQDILDTAIKAVQDFSLLVKGGQSVQASVASIPLPRSAADIGTTATAVQAAIVTAEAVISSLQANGVNTNINQNKLNDVNIAISKVVAAANTFAALQQAQQRTTLAVG